MKLDLSRIYYSEYDVNPSKIVLKDRTELNLPLSKINEYIGIRAHGSPNIIKIPNSINNDLAYLTGVILGDGSIGSPSKRKAGGYYWQVKIEGELEFIKISYNLIKDIFGYTPILFPDKRRNNTWHLQINSIIIHRFFNRVIGIKCGKKNGNTTWLDPLCKKKTVFKHFLAGFTDANGYVGSNYLAIIQSDKEFLERLKCASMKILSLKFNGPYVNRRINDEVVGWWITMGKKETNKFLKEIPLKYKNRPCNSVG